MTAKEFAQKLNGRRYMEEISKEETLAAEENSLVIVFGNSDDLIELRGAIHDEFDAYDGGDCFVSPDGRSSGSQEPGFTKISARWNNDPKLPCWTYETEIPHETFLILDEDNAYCEGIVFALDNIPG